MESENKAYRVHCLILPYPLQGHINPMLQFSKRVKSKQIKVTLVATRHMFNTTISEQAVAVPTIPVETISDGYDQGIIKVVDWMAKFLPLRTIGPTIPSMFLDKRLQDDTEYGLSIFKPNTGTCMNWLEERPNGSVVYVSFGSLAELGVDQMEELAWGLGDSNYHFLWVVGSKEEAKLPKDFVRETSEKGLVVSWCPQLQVLAHKAVGCFVTHCGWNSTLEALSLGVPMVAMPQWTDQSTNAKYVMDVWRMGLRVRCNDKGIVRREEIEHCVREVMEGERGKEMKRNAIKWSELAKEAVGEGGSSDRNIHEIVAKLGHSTE
ncbi:hypothetical protein ACSBR1_033031 [Camellia fascicularis]